MKSSTHVAIDITIILLIKKIFNVDHDTAVLIMSSGISSLLPDIDQKQSTIGTITPAVDDIIVKASKIVTKFNIKFLQGYFSHRGFTHSLLIPSILTFIYFKFNNPVWLFGLIVGYLAHLFADMLNDRGVPLFMPIYNKKFKILKITTGGNGEKILWYLTWVINIILILNIMGYVNF